MTLPTIGEFRTLARRYKFTPDELRDCLSRWKREQRPGADTPPYGMEPAAYVRYVLDGAIPEAPLTYLPLLELARSWTIKPVRLLRETWGGARDLLTEFCARPWVAGIRFGILDYSPDDKRYTCQCPCGAPHTT